MSHSPLYSLKHVGLVTLISVKYSPITSRPTKVSFLSLNTGATCSQIQISFSVRLEAIAVAPAAKLPLSSPSAGTREIAAPK